jgi:uncharacterized membrane protein YsdA (DUF1294 family)
MQATDRALLVWIAATSLLAFALFACDKSSARRSGSRVSEFQLVLIAALGGWLGGLAAMLMLRHKTAKPSFLLKYSVAFLVWLGLIYLWHTRL